MAASAGASQPWQCLVFNVPTAPGLSQPWLCLECFSGLFPMLKTGQKCLFMFLIAHFICQKCFLYKSSHLLSLWGWEGCGCLPCHMDSTWAWSCQIFHNKILQGLGNAGSHLKKSIALLLFSNSATELHHKTCFRFSPCSNMELGEFLVLSTPSGKILVLIFLFSFCMFQSWI